MRISLFIRNMSAAIFFATAFFCASAQQIDCDKAEGFTQRIAEKTAHIDTEDPEIITLHHIFVKEMLDSVRIFQDEFLPNLHFCPQIDFFATLHQSKALEYQLRELNDRLEVQRRRVDTLFYLKAVDELAFHDTAMCEYYLDRSLQFNRVQADALIMRLQLDYAQKHFDECLATLRILYHDATLNREQENALSDFNLQFYQELYNTGDALVKSGREADALALFETLETFCHDLPSSYCNDDYYHGLIRSKSGIYESYLTIAKVAWERKHPELAFKFLDYAKEYRLTNEDEVLIPEHFVKFIEEMEALRPRYSQPNRP